MELDFVDDVFVGDVLDFDRFLGDGAGLCSVGSAFAFAISLRIFG